MSHLKFISMAVLGALLIVVGNPAYSVTLDRTQGSVLAETLIFIPGVSPNTPQISNPPLGGAFDTTTEAQISSGNGYGGYPADCPEPNNPLCASASAYQKASGASKAKVKAFFAGVGQGVGVNDRGSKASARTKLEFTLENLSSESGPGGDWQVDLKGMKISLRDAGGVTKALNGWVDRDSDFHMIAEISWTLTQGSNVLAERHFGVASGFGEYYPDY